MTEEFRFMRWRYANDERTKVEVEIAPNANALTASDLERAMLELAEVRSQVLPTAGDMTPGIPPALWVDSPVVTVHSNETEWFLSVCDPGRGWLHYRFPRIALPEFQRAIENAISRASAGTTH